MKKIVTPLVIVLTASLLLVSCKDDKKKVLTRTWKISDIKISGQVPEEQKAFFDAMLQQMKEYLRMTYNADGTYNAAFLGKSSLGKWELNKDTLSATDETGKTMKYLIQTLSKDSFIYQTLEQGVDPVTFVLVPGDTLTNVPTPIPSPTPQGEPSAEQK